MYAHFPNPELLSAALGCGGAVANRLRRRTSDQTVLGSNPAVAAALASHCPKEKPSH